MSNQDFFNKVFPDFWDKLDRSRVIEDSESMFGDTQVFDWLIDVVKPELIVEIGSWKGHSANYMIDRCRKNELNSKMICVDTFLGGPEHWVMANLIDSLYRVNGQPTILNAFLGNTIARGNEGRIFPFTIDSPGGAAVLNYYNFRADMVFVDGAHGYKEVIADITGYYPLLADGGVMFGDDYQHKEVADAVHYCAEQLKVPVIVSARKWIFFNETLARRIGLADFQLRHSFEGWQHP